MSMMTDDKSHHSSQKNRFQNGNPAFNQAMEKEKILKIDEYTDRFLDTVKQKFQEMEACYKDYQDEIQ